jgi:hypothetical protein
MQYNTLAIFSDAQLVEIEFTLNQWSLMPQGMKNELTKAVEDYRFLVSSLSYSRGLSEQVILFLLDSKSVTNEGIQEFFQKLEIWLQVLEDENEQRVYADILRFWNVSYLDSKEILALRSELISILVEVEETRRSLKKTKNPQDILVKNKVPMQLDSEFSSYETWMMSYGSEFDREDSIFNTVPNLKGKLIPSETELCDAFSVYCLDYEVPTLVEGVGSETIL